MCPHPTPCLGISQTQQVLSGFCKADASESCCELDQLQPQENHSQHSSVRYRDPSSVLCTPSSHALPPFVPLPGHFMLWSTGSWTRCFGGPISSPEGPPVRPFQHCHPLGCRCQASSFPHQLSAKVPRGPWALEGGPHPDIIGLWVESHWPGLAPPCRLPRCFPAEATQNGPSPKRTVKGQSR